MSKVYVLGSINADLVAVSDNFPKAGETIHGKSFSCFSGGKGANQAVAATRLGSDVALIGAIGTDYFGQGLKEFLNNENISTQYIAEHPHLTTGVAVISVAGGDNKIIVIAGANEAVSPESIRHIPLQAKSVCVAQLETPVTTVQAFFQRAKESGAICILNPSPSTKEGGILFQLADIIVMNETELSFFCGSNIHENTPTAELLTHISSLAPTVDQYTVVTLGSRGAIVFRGQELHLELPGHKVLVVDSTGAGDCFCGALAHFLSSGLSVSASVTRANQAAALSVQKAGASTSMPTASELEKAWSESNPSPIESAKRH